MKSTRNQVSANHWNLLNIQIDTFFASSRQDLSAANTSSPGRPHFVPSILLSNAMSLAPKIDENAYTLNHTNTSIAFFSETQRRSQSKSKYTSYLDGAAKIGLTAGFVCMPKTPSSARYYPIVTVTIVKYYG